VGTYPVHLLRQYRNTGGDNVSGPITPFQSISVLGEQFAAGDFVDIL
jgi:hypothetical protein